MRLVKQSLGAKLAIGVYGTPEEIESRMTSLVQWGAAENALHLGCPESFQYVLTTEERLRDYFATLASLPFDIERLDMHLPAMVQYLANQANAAMDMIQEETFLRYGQEFYDSVCPFRFERESELQIA